MNTLDMIGQLVAFNTVSSDSNLPVIEFIESYLDDLGIQSYRVPSDDGRKTNLYTSVGPEREGGVVLSGHTDVVPVEGQDWESDPFKAVVRNGCLYGRGTCDMKGFIGTALALVPEMKHLTRPIHFALSYDEEVGCLGAPRMIEKISQNLPTPEAVIIGEPTEMTTVTGHKGIVTLKTNVRGYETHSSQTQRGISAVMTAAKLVNYLDSMAQALAKETDSDTGFDPHHTTIHVGIIRGGTAINIVSRHCEFLWDIRNIPTDDPRALIDQFERYCRDEILPAMRSRHSGCFIETEVLSEAPSFTASDFPGLALIQSLTGLSDCGQVSYVAEAGQFQAAGFPTVICGPGSIDQAHQPNEFITRHKGTASLRQGKILNSCASSTTQYQCY